MTKRNLFHLVSFGAVSKLTLGGPVGEEIEPDFTLWEIEG